MKEKILKILEECKAKGHDDLHFKEDMEYIANAIVENGTLIELPCKVGDKVYFVNEYAPAPRIEEYEVLGIIYDGKEMILQIPVFDSVYAKYIYKTKAEAEARLKELQNER